MIDISAKFEDLGLITLTPSEFARIRGQVSADRFRVPYVLAGAAFMNVMVNDPDWHSLVDPTTRHEFLMQGHICNCFGTSIYSDAYCLERQVADNALFLFSERDGNLVAHKVTFVVE
ncbi:hypothetical protein [Achromobacter phage Motura]|uniref:Uncharacterized protein n=1 Tax=Achromobacter phage Motura TaxID=2591403 RepID=A0A514CSE5_9CAUD|nr:hypothetical protein H1O15_gp073 [Achromobacter phage Motura]QDH83390.1 hypothetical protein [Achromobacter phage Motura]